MSTSQEAQARADARQAEAEWVARLRAGEEAAFDELITRFQDQLFSVVCHWLGNEEEAKDVVQETFIRAWSHARSFRAESSLRSWLFAIARNACKNTFRTWSRRARKDTLSLDASVNGSSPLEMTDPGLTALDRIEQQERVRVVREVIQELEPDFRIVVTLCDMEGLSYDEAAEACECPVGTVRSRLHRARAEMKRRLEAKLR